MLDLSRLNESLALKDLLDPGAQRFIPTFGYQNNFFSS
jgi:hypothetical protein